MRTGLSCVTAPARSGLSQALEEGEQLVGGPVAAGFGGVSDVVRASARSLIGQVGVEVPGAAGRADVSVNRVGCAARSGFTVGELRPFPHSLPPNPPGGFHRNGLSSDYAACVTGVAWMTSWQVRQTTRVFRRIFAMRAAHAGWPGPGWPSRASLATWWTSTAAPCPHSSHRRARSLWVSSLRGAGIWTGTGLVMTRSCRAGAVSRRTVLPGPSCLRGGPVLRSTCAARTVSRSWP